MSNTTLDIIFARSRMKKPAVLSAIIAVWVEHGKVAFRIDHQSFSLYVPEETPQGMTRDEYLHWYADNLQAAFNRLQKLV